MGHNCCLGEIKFRLKYPEYFYGKMSCSRAQILSTEELNVILTEETEKWVRLLLFYFENTKFLEVYLDVANVVTAHKMVRKRERKIKILVL